LKRKKQLVPTSIITFTARELEIIQYLLQGLKNKEIADKLFISTKTVNAHKQNLRQKYGFQDMLAVAVYCLQHHIIEINTS